MYLSSINKSSLHPGFSESCTNAASINLDKVLTMATCIDKVYKNLTKPHI